MFVTNYCSFIRNVGTADRSPVPLILASQLQSFLPPMWNVINARDNFDFTIFCVHVTVHRNMFIFNKTNRRTNFAKFIFVKKIYIFRALPLPIIRSFPQFIRHWYMSCKFDDSFQARSGWNILNVLESCHQNCMTYTSAKCTVDGQRNCPKHVNFLDKNEFEKN